MSDFSQQSLPARIVRHARLNPGTSVLIAAFGTIVALSGCGSNLPHHDSHPWHRPTRPADGAGVCDFGAFAHSTGHRNGDRLLRGHSNGYGSHWPGAGDLCD